MKRRLVFLLALAGLAWAAPLSFPQGFTIEAPRLEPGDQAFVVTILFFAPSEGFQPNVNVMVQPYADGIEAYLRLTRKQFDEAGFETLTATALDARTAVFEYTGTFQGRSMHWYARAVKRGAHVYLITAAATQGQWPALSAELKRVVDSFRLSAP